MRVTGRTLAPWLLALMLSVVTMLPHVALADGAWLDDEAVNWNEPGMAMPHPQEMTWESDPRCDTQLRPAASDEDRAIESAGWKTFSSFTGGWKVWVAQGLAGYDGMCRPLEYQAFVFVDGKLAGTLSPVPMNSRTDGALVSLDFYSADRIVASYVRYTDQDPLCCPSARSAVIFKIEQTERGPVVVRESSSTEPTSAARP